MICACGNSARYVDETGALTCALCPLRSGRDSIRITDVPALLKWCRSFIAAGERHEAQGGRPGQFEYCGHELRALIPRKP